ncbi:MAG TPA: hypothetical protein VN844_08060, partial [Pyrinomonadaceae bacterium]|nr:hypothetical protein [Pyrinomonadaceae bacterium]
MPPAASSADAEDLESELASDLPRDSAYEQTSIGLEWLGVLDEMTDRAVNIEISLSVYVRRY